MVNLEEKRVLENAGEKRERANKRKMYAGYLITGFFVGYIPTAIWLGEPLWLFMGAIDLLETIILFVLVVFPTAGGMVGGVLFKKWWGAIIGSVIANLIGYVIVWTILIRYLPS